MADKTTQPKDVKVFARYIHVSPRKLRLVADMVRGAGVDVALQQLRFSSKTAALPLTKAINSGIANAIHNFNLTRENLYIKTLTIDGGPVMKRYAPRAQGRAFVERKRTSHINVILSERTSNKSKSKKSIFSLRPRQAVEEKETVKGRTQPEEGYTHEKNLGPKQAPRSSEKRKGTLISLKRRLFNRKSGE